MIVGTRKGTNERRLAISSTSPGKGDKEEENQTLSRISELIAKSERFSLTNGNARDRKQRKSRCSKKMLGREKNKREDVKARPTTRE